MKFKEIIKKWFLHLRSLLAPNWPQEPCLFSHFPFCFESACNDSRKYRPLSIHGCICPSCDLPICIFSPFFAHRQNMTETVSPISSCMRVTGDHHHGIIRCILGLQCQSASTILEALSSPLGLGFNSHQGRCLLDVG